MNIIMNILIVSLYSLGFLFSSQGGLLHFNALQAVSVEVVVLVNQQALLQGISIKRSNTLSLTLSRSPHTHELSWDMC